MERKGVDDGRRRGDQDTDTKKGHDGKGKETDEGEKEEGMFVASGTMSNQIGLRVQLGPMTSLITDSRSHVYQHEAGGVAFHSQAQVDPVRAEREEEGFLSGRLVRESYRGPDQHHAVSSGVSLENTLLGLLMPFPLILVRTPTSTLSHSHHDTH